MILESQRDPTTNDRSGVINVESGVLWRNTGTNALFVCVDPGGGEWTRIVCD